MIAWPREKDALYWLCSTTILCLLLAFLFRLPDALLPGELPYYHLRIAEAYFTGWEDPLYHVPLPLTPFHVLLAAFVAVFGRAAGFILPFLLMVGSSMLFYFILKERGVPYRVRFLTVLLLATSPISVFAGVSLSEASFSVFVLCLGFYLYLQSLFPWSSFFFLLALLQNVFNLAVVFLLLGYEMWLEGVSKQHTWFFMLVILALVIHPFRLDPLPETDVYKVITDLGAPLGIGIFTGLLLLFGLHRLWKDKYAHLAMYMLGILGLVSWFLLGNSIAVYLNFYFSYLAAWGLLSLFESIWESALLKQFTIIVLICGLLFSFLSYVNRIGNAFPDAPMQEAALWFTQEARDGLVLTAPSRAFWIEYFGSRRTFSSPLNPRGEDINRIFYSRHLGRTLDVLETNNIRYIWIDRAMQHAIWSKEDEGLLFLFRDKEKFRKVYDAKGIRIWKVM
ncbi:hypothetical protein HY639_03345 [Candidatus Woesearchaeota archaeon]|nr:hypothetical protein [Candidatus Woesearchaeota archaeon]